MVLRTDLDNVDGAMHEASTEKVNEFFCYRCNMTKKSRHRVFWHVPGGMQVLCKPCGDEIRAKADRRRKHRKAATAVVATPVVCPNLLQLEEDRASLAASEFLTRFIALIAAELRPGLGPHFFQVYETTMQRLGVAHLLPSSATLIDQGPSDDPNFVDIDQMLALSNAMVAARAALAADAAAAVDKLHTRLVFFEARRANADAWANELITLLRVVPPPAAAGAASTSATTAAESEPTLLGLTAGDFKRVRGLLFYRNCRYSVRLLRALNERIGKAARVTPPANELKMEFWATISSLRCCTEPLAENPISDELRELGAALLRIAAIRRGACGLLSSQATRLFDWLKQGELAGLIRPEQATPPARKPTTPYKAKQHDQQPQQQHSKGKPYGKQAAASVSNVARVAGQKRGWNGGNNAAAAADEPQLTAKQKRQHYKNQKRQKEKQRRAEDAAKEPQHE